MSEKFHGEEKRESFNNLQEEEKKWRDAMDERKSSTVERIKNNPPSFYENGTPRVPSDIEDADLAAQIAKLGRDYGSMTDVIEWNRKEGHHFILSTFLPDASGRDVQVYSKVSLEVAKRLVEQEGIPTQLGYYQGDTWYNEETDEWEHEPAKSFTEPLLGANRERKE